MKKPDFDTLNAKHSNVDGKSSMVSRSFAQEETKSGKPMSNSEYIELIVGRIESAHIDITQDEADWTRILMGIATTFGESGRQYAQRISQFYVGKHGSYDSTEVDHKYDWCLNHGRGNITFATFVGIAKDYGVDVSMPPGYYPADAAVTNIPQKQAKANAKEKKKEKVNNTLQIQEWLKENAEIRQNVINGKYEIRYINEDSSSWRPFDDLQFNTIYTRVKATDIKTNKGDFGAIIESEDFLQFYNPVQEYFDSLQPWNPDEHPGEDPIDEFFGVIQVPDEQKEFARKYCRKWFLCFVAMMLGKISANQLMLALIGEMNTGKTFFCKNILPPVLRSYFDTLAPNQQLDKDQRIAMASKLLVLFDECKMTKKSSATMKYLLSMDKTNDRAAYDRFAKDRVRRASFVATGNDKFYIAEESGDRRYISLQVLDTKPDFHKSLPYDAAYAQAAYLINQPDFSDSLTQEEVQEIAENNKDYVSPDTCESIIEQFYRKPESHEKGIRVNATQIFLHVPITFHINEFTIPNIGKAMTKLGFPKKKVNGKTFYYVMEIDQSTLDEQSRREGEMYYYELQAQEEAQKQAAAQAAQQAQGDIFSPEALDQLYDDREDDTYETTF